MRSLGLKNRTFNVKTGPQVTCDTEKLGVNCGLSRPFRYRVRDRHVTDEQTDGHP